MPNQRLYSIHILPPPTFFQVFDLFYVASSAVQTHAPMAQTGPWFEYVLALACAQTIYFRLFHYMHWSNEP